MTPPMTRAESSGWRETSLHADVIAFLAALDGRGERRLRLSSFGASPEGRDLPLAVLSDRGFATPAEAHAGGSLVVLVICGIHAGEVEGKEAGLMLLRDLLDGRHPGLLDGITLVLVPLYNPDGNDRIDPKNRKLDLSKFHGQIGPDAVGTRTNAAGINLNRDYLRKDALESRLLHERVFLAWSPHLTIDCHSTNGSVHRFALTYDAPHTIASGRPEPIRFVRDTLLPEVTRRVRAASGRETFFYGNFIEDDGGAGAGWITYTHHPRFGSNYRGLTGRMDVLFECYSYLPFEERVATTYELLVETLRVAGARAETMRGIVAASQTPPTRIAVRYRLEADPTPARILTREPRTLEGAPVEVKLPHLCSFSGAHVVERPFAYAVPAPIAAKLALHGLTVRRLDAGDEVAVEVARVVGIGAQGSRSILEADGERLLETELVPARRRLPAGTQVVETAQPLGAIATYLCEAASDDGLVACGWIPEPSVGDEWPVLRVVEPIPG
jgi:Zinc carboxypeptidase